MSNVKGNKKLNYEENHRIDENGELYKLCNKHDLYFPEESPWIPCTEEYFYKNKSSKKDGLNTWCKRCTVRKSVQWGKDNPLKRHKYLEVENKKDIRKAERRESSKKRRERGDLKKWQENNPDKVKQYNLNREQHKAHTISKKEWKNCKEYFNNQCAYCGLPIEEHFITRKGVTKQGDFHREHFNHDGANDLSNCIPSCKQCNSEKHTYKFEEWFNENNIKFNQERLDKIHKWINEDYKLHIKK